MKELPKVYVNPIDREIKNYQQVTDAISTRSSASPKNLSMKIKDIFNSPNYVYKKRVSITLKDKIVDKVIVGKTNGYLLTIENEKIKLSDIYDINLA